MRRLRLAAAAVVALTSAYLIGQATVSFAATQSTRRSTTASGTAAGVEEKLDAVLAGQEKILQQLNAVMEELRIIKIRASMQ